MVIQERFRVGIPPSHELNPEFSVAGNAHPTSLPILLITGAEPN